MHERPPLLPLLGTSTFCREFPKTGPRACRVPPGPPKSNQPWIKSAATSSASSHGARSRIVKHIKNGRRVFQIPPATRNMSVPNVKVPKLMWHDLNRMLPNYPRTRHLQRTDMSSATNILGPPNSNLSPWTTTLGIPKSEILALRNSWPTPMTWAIFGIILGGDLLKILRQKPACPSLPQHLLNPPRKKSPHGSHDHLHAILVALLFHKLLW